MFWHKLTHRHKELYKAGIGQIKLCSGRFRNRNIINLAVSMYELYDTVYVVPRVKEIEFEEIVKCRTEGELARVIVAMIEVRKNSPYKVKVLVDEWTGEK